MNRSLKISWSKGIVALMHRINYVLLQCGYYIITDCTIQQILLCCSIDMHMLYISSITTIVALMSSLQFIYDAI
jgi:hypothetical protein